LIKCKAWLLVKIKIINDWNWIEEKLYQCGDLPPYFCLKNKNWERDISRLNNILKINNLVMFDVHHKQFGLDKNGHIKNIDGITYIGDGTFTAAEMIAINGVNVTFPGDTYVPNHSITAEANNAGFDVVTGLLYRSNSAKKYKDKIKDMELDSSLIYKLQPRSFNSLCDMDDKNKRFHGFVADEMEKFLPEIIDYNEKGEVEAYDNRMLMTLMLAEVQKHEARITALEKRI